MDIVASTKDEALDSAIKKLNPLKAGYFLAIGLSRIVHQVQHRTALLVCIGYVS